MLEFYSTGGAVFMDMPFYFLCDGIFQLLFSFIFG